MTDTARGAPTQFVDVDGRRLAYRRIGSGPPMVLCLRFRGVLDDWDPAFLDALAEHFSVVTFDYTGLGRSTGHATYDRESLARDAYALVEALDLGRVVIGGWSLGGVAAQLFTMLYPERTSHAILIGTVPPGPQPHPAEPIFFPTALRPENDLEDETILFFEPNSAASREAARRSNERIASRTADRSPPIPEDVYLRLVSEGAGQPVFPDPGNRRTHLANTPIPLLAINGDHDVCFPVENWYALNRQWRSLHVFTFPRAGHGPQHEFPEICADVIASFVRNTGGPR